MRTILGLLDWRSLRWRIAALVAVSACAVALAVGLLVHDSTLARSMNDGGSRALTDLGRQVDAYRGGGDARGLQDPAVMPPPLARRVREDGEGTWYENRPPSAPRMWAARTDDGRVFVSYVDMTPDLLTREALDRHMWKASLGVLAIVVPLSVLLAELPNRRLRRVARTARRIADGDLGARNTAAGSRRSRGDEITGLSASVDEMADSLQDRLVREQRFTADVAHELRTPLMGLVTSAGLLPESRATDMVRDRVAVLRVLVEDLLEISRLDAGAEAADPVPVPLAEMVAESVARCGLDVSFTAVRAATVGTDPRRVDRIVTNLVTNAHRHGAAPVEVAVEGRTVVVRDHGPGFPAALLAEGPQRFRTGTDERGRGHGLGLTLALGQARVLGAELVFTDAPGGGACATLRLPPNAPSGPGTPHT
ncbi:sensor histidine kinase [Streptomyces fuscigenes]|uniref:sensor histidine kinase n=1 Tax=Streptomyces fuscigenes TaxID=1528880 RepID=UPI001F3DC23F|nr:HAMP domain-containing sensor histidine kinase [Streptomyces fuscigenes]MCF3962479.1 HAMP domain-containing histidine kinase [Streptomyces fuscigenes]